MTDRAAPRRAHGKRSRRAAWIGWPASFALTVGAALTLHKEAVETKLEGLFWAAVFVVGGFYVVVAILYLPRLIRRGWRESVEFLRKARDHDRLQSELAGWKSAAGEATARADDAEARIATSRLAGLKEGRRRVIAELRASAVKTTFRNIEVGMVEGVLVIGAKWSGQVPEVDSRYVLRSVTLLEPKAVLECAELRENKTAVFRVSSVVSDSYRSQLVATASATGGILTDVEVAPRVVDLEKEPIWPEN